jgi:alkyl sulfatase BDS1-like metallo-beta-lactamase superfamily hydrolase
MDAQELFNVKIPAALQKSPDKAKEINAIFQFNIEGEGGGKWAVDLTATGPTCNPGEASNAQCTITIQHEDFKTLLGNPSAGMQLYFQGKLKIAGDPMLATKLQKLFSLT